jgi:tetratricopeptide (TPR) repeat protein
MSTPARKPPLMRNSRARSDGLPTWLAAIVLALAIGLVYGRALDVPFILDDESTILGNKSIASLWPLIGTAEDPGPLRPPVPLPTAGRPLVNLTFAINFSIGRLSPIGYHAFNVLVHFAATLLLFALVRRTLLLPYFAGPFENSATWLALAIALIWALHPLQTETVIYATQRTELMMAFFYLATLYCSLRYWLSDTDLTQRRVWLTLAVFACLAGMASKEVMVSAPIMVLLYERTFVAGSLPKSLRSSWPLYAGLAATWLLLVALNIYAPRGDTAGFHGQPSLLSSWLTQTQVLLVYFKLVVWPWPLLIQYQLPYLKTFGEAWTYVVPILLLGITTIVLLWRNRPAGYLGAWIFAILAPTTVIPIFTEVAAERRMYLPLAAFVAMAVICAYLLMQSLLQRGSHAYNSQTGSSFPRILPASAVLVIAFVFGFVSAKRANAYHNVIGLWQEVVALEPANLMAHFNLGQAYERAGRLPEAIAELQVVTKADPNKTIALVQLGLIYINLGRLPEAIDLLQDAVKREPNAPVALNNLGSALTKTGRASEAVEYLERAIQTQPNFADAHNNLGIAFGNLGKVHQAIEEFQRALAYRKNYANAHNNLGVSYNQLGEKSKAIEQFNLGLQIKPNDAHAHHNLAVLLAGEGQTAFAIAHFEQAIRLFPQFADAENGLGDALRKVGRSKEAIEHHQKALEIKPDFVDAYASLAQSLALAGQPNEATLTAQKGIEVARTTNQTRAASQLNEWLTHYQVEAQRAADSPPAERPK